MKCLWSRKGFRNFVTSQVTYSSEVFVISQGIPKLRNMSSTYFSEAFCDLARAGIPKLHNISTDLSEVFVISQGILKLRNISTNLSEVFVISQGIPKLRNISTYFREICDLAKQFQNLIFKSFFCVRFDSVVYACYFYCSLYTFSRKKGIIFCISH